MSNMMKSLVIAQAVACATLAANAFTDAEYAAVLSAAKPTEATAFRAPAWANGTCLYRVATPDAPCLGNYLKGLKAASRMLDGDVRMVTLSMGLVGHDHLGGWNWDGLWPYWNRPTFRVGGWEGLRAFMEAADREANTKISFHVNLTDVNTGLADYPESLAFFRRMRETGSLYRRDWDKSAKARVGSPYVMTEEQLKAARNADKGNPIEICSLVNYKRFWDSGLAKEMIDEFYAHLPYAPPVLYLDVFNEQGGNFHTGFPEGGSFQTQQEGATNICAYLRKLGTEVGTEGGLDRFLGEYGTYGWLHCIPGYSRDDYSKILGASKGALVVLQHVMGCTGSFCLSPVAHSDEELAADRAHWATLLRGEVSGRPMPTARTWHVADRGNADDRYNQMPGLGGDPFRGSWVDLVNDFYLVSIQELYHIGRGSWRTKVRNTIGVHHLGSLEVIDEKTGSVLTNAVADGLAPDAPKWVHKTARKNGRLMLEAPLRWKVTCVKAGPRSLRIQGFALPFRGGLNVYVNGRLVWSETDFRFDNPTNSGRPATFAVPGAFEFRAGENEVAVDAGPVAAEWSDGTRALWLTPALGRGFEVRRGDVVFARDYDRMWPDTWSGKRKIHFFSWNGCREAWTLPEDWAGVTSARLYPLTPDGRGAPVVLAVKDRRVTPNLLPQVPSVLEPCPQERTAGGME